MGSQNKILVDEHRNNPEMELYDDEMAKEIRQKKKLDRLMEEAE